MTSILICPPAIPDSSALATPPSSLARRDPMEKAARGFVAMRMAVARRVTVTGPNPKARPK